MDYIRELRNRVGTRPLLLPGALVVLIDDKGRILLTRRTDTGEWSLPGGHMEPGETITDTACREVREEIGLVVEDLTLLGVFSGPEFYYRYPNGDEIYKVTLVYSAPCPPGSLALDAAEVKEAAFFPVDALPRDMFIQERRILARVLPVSAAAVVVR
ncbi:NUDIX hydrolase [Streptomyces sp. NPDC002809]|uniref:NUDIX hydrolase n=1 Tax=Streptomyces sp. NPDC002809 TaxID=3154433 RepID=UPI00331D8EDE